MQTIKNKLGLKLWSTNTDHYYNEAKTLYRVGIFDYIELYIVPNTSYTLEKWSKLDVPFIVHCAHFTHGFNLANKEKEKNNEIIYNETKLFADTLKSPYIIFHGGVDGNIEETARQLKNISDERALIENKPYIAIPNNLGAKLCRGYNIKEIEYVMKTANCGFCLDFGHAICSANSQNVEIYKYCEDFLLLNPTMFHLTDIKDINSPYDTHEHLGKGELNISKIKTMIPDNAIITFETEKNDSHKLDDFCLDLEIYKNAE